MIKAGNTAFRAIKLGNKLMFHDNTRDEIEEIIAKYNGIQVTSEDHLSIIGVVNPHSFEITEMPKQPGYFVSFNKLNFIIEVENPAVDDKDKSKLIFPHEKQIFNKRRR